MKIQDVRVGDVVMAEHGFTWHKFVVTGITPEGKVIIRMGWLGIVTELNHRDWYFVKRPETLKQRIRRKLQFNGLYNLFQGIGGVLKSRNYRRVNRRIDEQNVELLENYKLTEAQIGRIYAILGEKPLPGLGDKLKVEKAPSDLAMKRRAIKAAKKISHARTKGKQIRRRK